ncbi:MAG: DUF2510 domain-containing protein [Actinobacteria bacterium]|nr:MAG: DUF2510 domain-containing protein [Actinomycetota bacterium]
MGDEGWYPDPYQPTHLRWWDGQLWTSNVRVFPRATSDRSTPPSSSKIDPFLRHIVAAGAWPILREAADRHIIDETQRSALVSLVNERCSPAPLSPPAAPPVKTTPLTPAEPIARVVAEPTAQRTTPPAPMPAPTATPAPGVVAIDGPREPSLLHRARSAVSSELAVHGLAYLGVLLLFAGVTGLTVFSTGDVRRGLRPVAELAAPASLLFAAWFLRRRHSTVVAAALDALAAAVLPIAFLASLLDGADIPPDPGDSSRIAVLTATCVALTVAYAWHSRRRPLSSWRFFVAPLG